MNHKVKPLFNATERYRLGLLYLFWITSSAGVHRSCPSPCGPWRCRDSTLGESDADSGVALENIMAIYSHGIGKP